MAKTLKIINLDPKDHKVFQINCLKVGMSMSNKVKQMIRWFNREMERKEQGK